jgi:putative DNA primase/helicase
MKKLAFDTLKHLKINEGVKRATNEYREEEDELGPFIAERCIPGGGQVERNELYSVYKDWAEKASGIKMPMT